MATTASRPVLERTDSFTPPFWMYMTLSQTSPCEKMVSARRKVANLLRNARGIKKCLGVERARIPGFHTGIVPRRAVRRCSEGDSCYCELSCRTTLSRDVLILRPPLYSMKPSFLNLFMKKFTRDRVVPIISASISCESLGRTPCGLSSFP